MLGTITPIGIWSNQRRLPFSGSKRGEQPNPEIVSLPTHTHPNFHHRKKGKKNSQQQKKVPNRKEYLSCSHNSSQFELLTFLWKEGYRKKKSAQRVFPAKNFQMWVKKCQTMASQTNTQRVIPNSTPKGVFPGNKSQTKANRKSLKLFANESADFGFRAGEAGQKSSKLSATFQQFFFRFSSDCSVTFSFSVSRSGCFFFESVFFRGMENHFLWRPRVSSVSRTKIAVAECSRPTLIFWFDKKIVMKGEFDCFENLQTLIQWSFIYFSIIQMIKSSIVFKNTCFLQMLKKIIKH